MSCREYPMISYKENNENNICSIAIIIVIVSFGYVIKEKKYVFSVFLFSSAKPCTNNDIPDMSIILLILAFILQSAWTWYTVRVNRRPLFLSVLPNFWCEIILCSVILVVFVGPHFISLEINLCAQCIQ